MRMPLWICFCLMGSGLLATKLEAQTVEIQALRESLHFHASFDGSMDANVTTGDKRMMTATTLERKKILAGNQRSDVVIEKGAGRYGDALRFRDRSPKVLMYSGENMHYQEKDWSGTVSFWMKLDPDKDLKPGYCDPIQITDKAWNDASFFVDFDKDLPRDFRLGVFSDLSFWNPKNIDWEQWPVEKRPMVTVKKPPFQTTEWTHVLFTFENLNASENRVAKATLYLNGKSQGNLENPMHFQWDLRRVAIMLGIEYIGDFDDLTIFRKALTEKEVNLLYRLPSGAAGLTR